MTASADFGTRLARAFEHWGQLCLGIDPHGYLLKEWGLGDDASGLRELGLRAVEAAHGRIGIVKPQIAFFERHGSAGYTVLEEVIRAAREAGLLVIADVKRGDVGSTVEAYGQAWLTPGGPLEADAMTISAYQGVGSLRAPLELAHAADKGLFVLAATSNPEARGPQTAVIADGEQAGQTVAAGIVDEVIRFNSAASTARDAGTGTDASARPRLGAIGVVLGATVDAADYGIRLDALARQPATPILAPGFGHQGAAFAELRSRYGPASSSVVAVTSRGVLAAGPREVADALDRASGELAECLA